MANVKTSIFFELIDKLTKPLQVIKKELGGFATEQKKLTESTNKSSNATNRQSKELSSLRGEAKKTKANMDDLATGFTHFVAGIGIASKIRNALSEAGNREMLSIKLSTVIGDNNQSEFENYFKELERTGIASMQEIVDTGYNLLSAGLNKNQAKLGTKNVIDVAKVTGGQADLVASTMATASKNFNISMDRVGDVLAKTQLKFQFANFGQLSAGFDLVGASASAIKLPLEQTATALGLLNDAGITGSNAGTSLNAVLRQMGVASKKLGIDINRGADGSLDLVGFLKQIDNKTKGFNLDKKAQIFQEIFGDEGKKGLLPLIANLDKMSASLEDVTQNSKDITKTEVAKFYELYDTKVKSLNNALGGFAATMGSAVIPHIVLLIETITPLINSFADFIAKNEWLGQVLFYTGVAVSGFVAILGGLYIAKFIGLQFMFMGKSVLFASKMFAIAGRVLGLLSLSFIKLGIAIMTTPIGWILAGIALIGAGAYLLIKHWKPAGDFFTSLWESIKLSVKTVYEWLLKYIIEPITQLWNKVQGFFGTSKIESSNTSTNILENKGSIGSNNVVPVSKQSQLKTEKGTTTIVYNNTFNINGSNINANEIVELVVQKLQKQHRTALSG